MPTGYTADIANGVSFKQFVMRCARAFGACATIRDAPMSAPIPDAFEASDYHLKAQQEARDRLVALDAMTPEGAERAAADAWDKAETARVARLQEYRDLRAKYEAMLAKVQLWVPPTPEHGGLRDFMYQQIIQSIDFDCNEKYACEPTARLTGAAWRAGEQTNAARSLAYHQREHEAEVQRAASQTAWMRALRASLNAEQQQRAAA